MFKTHIKITFDVKILDIENKDFVGTDWFGELISISSTIRRGENSRCLGGSGGSEEN